MGISIRSSTSLQRLAALPLAAALASLSACYVVPLEARHAHPAPAPAQVSVAPPAPVTFPVRLYPTNDLAARYGMVSATVTNDLHGKGVFSTHINGEAFSGEATRKTDLHRNGVANGAGNRGAYISCTYSMNSSTQGTGQCRLSDGAEFSMHMGN
ncbi:hypothetical protein H5407_18960 [Mitsuaria sp. WAJ17]|uniref:hypothetical protein n=1 Tax=Mitsuaria sp. WAJ17 TaxID=2761452 RepID=UPI001602329B|nr:hypothetical protein [Mitsuaria sp. WAJ17]MBB2487320.1 hypothetical protein [Mitsuaria sp. WAJ17]